MAYNVERFGDPRIEFHTFMGSGYKGKHDAFPDIKSDYPIWMRDNSLALGIQDDVGAQMDRIHAFLRKYTKPGMEVGRKTPEESGQKSDRSREF